MISGTLLCFDAGLVCGRRTVRSYVRRFVEFCERPNRLNHTLFEASRPLDLSIA